MNIAIVDDLEADRLRLEQTLRQYAARNRLDLQVSHFSSGEMLLARYQPFQYTVIFLDIFMDGLSGIETAETLREMDPHAILVFLTTSEVHRSEAFSVFATAYLRKPTDEAQIFRVLDYILLRKTDMNDCFSFSFDRRDYSLPFAEIVSIETDGNYLLIKDRQGRCYRTRMTFTRAQSLVDARFLTLMRGILVNMEYIRQIRDGICTMQNGETFPLHTKKKRELLQKWLNFKFAAIREAAEEG